MKKRYYVVAVVLALACGFVPKASATQPETCLFGHRCPPPRTPLSCHPNGI